MFKGISDRSDSEGQTSRSLELSDHLMSEENQGTLTKTGRLSIQTTVHKQLLYYTRMSEG